MLWVLNNLLYLYRQTIKTTTNDNTTDSKAD
jgi:hypothetical protein